MKASLALLLPLALATLSVNVAATELVPLEWSADSAFSKETTVPAGKFVEACGKLPAKAKVTWSFEAGGPTDFNIHYHEGKKVRFPAKKSAVAKASGTLDAKVEQDYCWMWTNKGNVDVSLQFQLRRL
jgi:hypothetical protein